MSTHKCVGIHTLTDIVSNSVTESPYKQRGTWSNENHWQPYLGFKYYPPLKARKSP